MPVKTKSIFKPAEEEDGIRVLITRYYPRGVRKDHFDLWVRELSPSADLLLKYKEGKVSWAEFKVSFLSEIRDNIDSLEVLYALNNESRNTDITLLCYEKEGQPCHRHLVRDIVEWPELLSCHFEPKDTDDHERPAINRLIAYKKTNVIRRVRYS